MNLDRLPEIVEAVKPTNADGDTLVYRPHTKYWWEDAGGLTTGCPSPTDAANACVVEMLRRLVANGGWVLFIRESIRVGGPGTLTDAGLFFPGDLLNALYDAFTAHPEWSAQAERSGT